MGQSEIATKERNKQAASRRAASVLIILFFGLTTLVSSAQPSCGQGANNLGALEQKLFFKTYADETDEARLNRLETHLFGQAMPGGFQDRLARVVGAASPQTNPDGSVSGSGSQQSAGTTSGTKEPTEAALKARAEDERQAAIERAKIAVMAARDEQTSKLIETGVSLWRSKRGSEALQYFEQALKTDSHNATALYYAGIVYESKKNYVEALSSYRKASNEDPGNQEYNDAVVAVQKLMNSRPAVDPKQAEISKLAREAGDAYKRGEYLSALDLYKQLDAKAPNQALVKYNLGMLYLQARHFQTALEHFQMAVQLRPTDQKFIQAYQQLKANIDKSEAAQKESEAAWGGNTNVLPGAFSSGGGRGTSNGMSGGMSNAGGAQVSGCAPYGHAAMNLAAQGVVAQGNAYGNGMPLNDSRSQNSGMAQNDMMQGGGSPQMNQMPGRTGPSNGMQSGSGFSQQGGGHQQGGFTQANQSNALASATSNGPVATPPGMGHEPGLASNDGPPSRPRLAPVQNSAKPAPSQVASAPDLSAVPPGQHPLVRHPLKSSKSPQGASTAASELPFQPEKHVVFNNRLDQPPPNSITELGIEAANSKSGVVISHVGIASRASKAGLLTGDIIRAVDNKVVTTLSQVMTIISKKGPGAFVELHIQRKDQMGVVHL